MDGEKVGLPIPFSDNDNEIVINHPLDAELFVSISHGVMRIFSWVDALENQHSVNENFNSVNPELKLSISQEKIWEHPWSLQPTTDLVVNLKSGHYTNSSSTTTSLEIWPASSISLQSGDSSSPLSFPGFDALAHKVRQIIAVKGTRIIFLDTDLWVCTLDVMALESPKCVVRRHFFLLSEWQSSDRRLVVEFVPVRCEFLIVKKHKLLVVRRGLDFSEPWYPLHNDVAKGFQ